jgi:hypothetical protein
VVSPSQDKVILAKGGRGPRLGRVEDELDHGLRGQEQGQRGLGRRCRAKVEVRVYSGGVRACGHHGSVAVRRNGRPAVMVVVYVEGGVRCGMQGGIPMRQAVPDLRQENGEAQDQPEKQSGKARPAEVMHGRQDSTTRDTMPRPPHHPRRHRFRHQINPASRPGEARALRPRE